MELLIIFLVLFVFAPLSFYKAFLLMKNPCFVAYKVIGGIDSLEVYTIEMNKNGIAFKGKEPKNITFEQLKCFDFHQEIDPDIPDKIIEKNKSVIGHALLGGLVLGPVGLALGAVAGQGTVRKVKKGKKGERRLYAHFYLNDGQEYLFKVVNLSKDSASRFMSAIRQRELSVAESSVS